MLFPPPHTLTTPDEGDGFCTGVEHRGGTKGLKQWPDPTVLSPPGGFLHYRDRRLLAHTSCPSRGLLAAATPPNHSGTNTFPPMQSRDGAMTFCRHGQEREDAGTREEARSAAH